MKNLALLFFLSACGKGPAKANPCATKGATYFEHTVEANNGTCGTIPDQIINVSPEGTVSGATSDCEIVEQNGCVAHNTNCKTSKDGVNCSTTTSVTFMTDGSSATGLITISCSGNGTACASTYQATLTRQ